MEATSLDSLERDFQEVLAELVGDKSLERFRQEYEKLHRALKKSHESEKRLIKKCRELNSEIVSNAAKVQTALKLSQEDQNTISSLKREIEKAWKMVDAAHEKEGRAKETIQQLKHEIQNLSRLVEQGAGLSIGQENTVNELMKVKQELAKERDARRADKSQFESRVAYGKEILGQKDAKLTQLAARLNKAEREATFLRQSRASPASAGGSGRDAKLEASHRNLEREYDLLRRKLNAALDRASKQLDSDVSDDGDQLRLYAGRVRQLEAQLQEKTMAAAVAAREAHDARCAAAEAGADLQDAKFEATRLKGDVARAELGRTPFRASARKSLEHRSGLSEAGVRRQGLAVREARAARCGALETTRPQDPSLPAPQGAVIKMKII